MSLAARSYLVRVACKLVALVQRSHSLVPFVEMLVAEMVGVCQAPLTTAELMTPFIAIPMLYTTCYRMYFRKYFRMYVGLYFRVYFRMYFRMYVRMHSRV